MMKQIGFEWKKIIKLRSVFFSVVGILLACCIFFGCSILMPGMGRRFSAGAYRNIVKEIKETSQDKAYDRLSKKYEEMMEGNLAQEDMYEDTYSQEFFLYEQILEELKQVTGYREYVQNVLENAKKSSIGFFSESRSMQLEQEKISADFQKMTDVEPHFTGSCAISAYMGTDLWDLGVVAIILILVHACILVEMEEKKIYLLRCTKNGKGKTAYAKFISGCMILVFLQILMYGFRFVFAGMAYGIPDLTADFQSVPGTMGCTWEISTGKAVLLFAGLKIFVTVTLFAFFFIAGLLLRNAWKFYITGLGVMAVSWIFYQQIDTNSFLVNLKWMNPAAFMAADSMLSNYRNLILFGHPIGYQWFVIISCLVFLGICVCFLGKLYCGIMPQKERQGSEKIFSLRELIAVKILGGQNIWGYECRKWSFYQKGFWFCVFLLIIAFAVYEPVSERLYTMEEIYYKYYVKKVEGDYTEEKMESLYRQEREFMAISKDLDENGARYTEAALAYYNRQLEKEPGLKAAIAYGEYLEGKGGDFIYEQGYEMLFGRGDGNFALLLCRFFSLAAMTVLSILIWHIEQSSKMNCLIRISMSGRRKTDYYKYGNILLCGLIVAMITYIPWIYNIFSVFGHAGLASSANSLQMFEKIPAQIPLLAVIVVFFLLHMIYLWLIGFLARPLSIKIKNGMVAVVLLFCMGILPILLLYRIS